MAEKSGVNTEIHENHMNNNNNNNNNERPPSANSRTNREERLKLLKEKQNEERLRKLEELKQHALQAARLREEQDFRRRKHFEEFGKKEEERRKQAEERRRQLEEDRKINLQTKWETKKNTLANHRSILDSNSKKPIYAFGSCTPRLVHDTTDGCLWKSQYNLNGSSGSGSKDSGHGSSGTAGTGTTKSTSAHDLHSQMKMSQSMYEWNQQRTTFTTAAPSIYDRNSKGSRRPRSMYYNSSTTKEMEPDRVFCGRRKTDLTPTIPIKRSDDGGPGSSRSTSRASGFSKSGQATPRPPSSMSSSMISSTHSTLGSVSGNVPMRPRNLASKKSRPVSVHVTGITTESQAAAKAEKAGAQSQRPATAKKLSSVSPVPPPTASKNLKSKAPAPEAKKPSATAPATIDTNTIKRAAKKKEAPKPPPAVAPATQVEAVVQSDPLTPQPAEIEILSTETTPTNPASAGPMVSTPEPKVDELSSISALAPAQDIIDFGESPSFLDAGQSLVVVQSEQKSMQQPSTNPFDVFMASPAVAEESTGNNNPFASATPNTEAVDFLLGNDATVAGTASDDSGAKQPKVLTEEEAKAALAEKRRLAREAQEREAARLEEEEKLEEERQRLEAEEAERLAVVARQMEEERLRVAIEEQRKREEEEKRRREEEDLLRLEREREEREAAREAERIRQEMEERLKREEEERLERKRRVEAIMSRTRKSGTDSAKATTPVPEEIPTTQVDQGLQLDTKQSSQDSEASSPLNNPNILKANSNSNISTTTIGVNGVMLLDPLAADTSPTPPIITNLNNYNNNHHSPDNANFSNTLIDFGGDSTDASPLVMVTTNGTGGGTGPAPGGAGTNNLINNGFQDLLS